MWRWIVFRMEKLDQNWDQKEDEEEENEVDLLRRSSACNNGHVNQSSNAANRPDNESVVVNGQRKEELNGILENEAEAKDGLKSEYFIYYDKDEGVELHSGEQLVEKNPADRSDVSAQKFYVQKSSVFMVKDRYEGDQEDQEDDLSISSSWPTEILYQEHGTTYEPSKERKYTDNDLINADDLEVTDLDVDRVLREQTTHDLYCPNCNSCITRRVILRKRKCTVRLPDEEGKRSKLGTAANSKLDTCSAQATGNQGHPTDGIGVDGRPIPIADDHVHDRGTDLFRCLSCFSFFIPIGNGFKLFRIFGENGAKENVQDEQIPSMEKNWLASIFASNKKETSVEQGSSLGDDERKSDIGLFRSPDLDYQSGKLSLMQKGSSRSHVSEGSVSSNGISESVEGRETILPSSRQERASGNGIVDAEGKSDNATTKKKDSTVEWFKVDTNNQLKESNFTIVVQYNHESGTPVTTPPNCTQVSIEDSAQDAPSCSLQGGSKLLISSNEKTVTLKESDNSQIPDQTIKIKAGSSLRPDEGKSDVGLIPSSDLDYQNGNSSLMEKGSSLARVSEGLIRTNWTSESLESRDKILPSSRQDPAFGKATIGVEKKSDNPTTKNKDSTVVSVMMPSSNATSTSRQGGLKLLISSNEESMDSRESDHGQVPDHTIQKIKADEEAITRLPTPVSALKESDANGKVSVSLDFAPEYEQQIEATVLTESVVESKNANFDSSIDGGIHPAEVTRHIITKTKREVHTGEPLKVDCISSVKEVSFAQGRPVNIIEDNNQVAADNGSDKDAIINVDTGPIETTSQRAQDVLLPAEAGSALHSSTQTRVTEHVESEPRKAYEIEVIKSIVYGGLAESISSLSVVSSAAGGNAATLNILALGMANVIGGLFVIGHNLWQLKSNCTEQVLNEVTEQGDRHKELLGWRQNFVIRATVAILSYIIFGLVPPVVYGFSFRKNNNKELKLVVVAVASLLCIAVLATGKAYTQRPPKSYSKTVLKYVVLGFVVLGFSYAAGVLIKRLLEKLGLFLFESSSVANQLLPEMMTTKPEWASY